MAYVVRMPKLGVEMEYGEVLEWQVSVGDVVEEGTVLAEIESEKTTAEVVARESGVLRRIYLEAGEGIEPGGPMGIVAPADTDIGGLEAEASETAPPDDEDGITEVDSTEPETTAADAEPTGGGEGPTVKATPKAKRRASELDVSLGGIEGTGPQGAVTADDVERAAGVGPEATDSAASMTVAESHELSPTRRTIATRLGRSYRDAPHVTLHRTIQVEELFDRLDAVSKRSEATIGFLDVLFLAVSATLDEHPTFNATFEDGVHRTYVEHNLAFAVDTDSGLVTPVLGDVGNRSPTEVAAERRRLTELTLAGEHETADLAGGTFTVSNLGSFGIDSFSPIINPPQVAILGVGRARERAVRTDEGLGFRRELSVSLSFDHRAVDGADSARFLETLASKLRTPDEVVDISEL